MLEEVLIREEQLSLQRVLLNFVCHNNADAITEPRLQNYPELYLNGQSKGMRIAWYNITRKWFLKAIVLERATPFWERSPENVPKKSTGCFIFNPFSKQRHTVSLHSMYFAFKKLPTGKSKLALTVNWRVELVFQLSDLSFKLLKIKSKHWKYLFMYISDLRCPWCLKRTSNFLDFAGQADIMRTKQLS